MGDAIGHNMKKLAIRFMTRDAIPPGGGLRDGIKFIANLSGQQFRDALECAQKAVGAVRSAKGGEQMGDDEEIAGMILSEIESRLSK